MKTKTVIIILAIFSIGIFTSCSKTEDVISSNNPFYIRGTRLLENGQYAKAADSFRKCLRLTPETTDAHLQLAMIHQDHLKKPVHALYHYKMFIEKGEDAKKVDMARQSLEKIKTQLAETSNIDTSRQPAQSTLAEDSKEKKERIKELERQKKNLLKKLKSVNAQRLEAEKRFKRLRTASSQDSPNTDEQVSNTDRVRVRETDIRVHTVQRGDTLIGLSRKYYNTDDLWDELQQFNNNTLHNKTALKPGMRIRIPAKEQLKE